MWTTDDRVRDGRENEGASQASEGGQIEAGETAVAGQAEEPGARATRRGQRLEALLSAGVSLLAIWLLGGLVLRPGPWIELARRLVGELTFPGS